MLLKPLSGVSPATRAGVQGQLAPLPEAHRLGPASFRVERTPFEQVLRAALAELKGAMQQLELEPDGVTRHLGYRALRRETNEQRADFEHLPDADERGWARELVDELGARESECLQALEPGAREELEVLLRCEQRAAEREAAAQRSTDAALEQQQHREALEQLTQRLAQRRARLARPRPAWVQPSGALLAVLSGLALFLAHQPPVLLVAVLGLPLGLWFLAEPGRRRWGAQQLAALHEELTQAKARQAASDAALAHALGVFETVEAEAAQEEAAAIEVLLKRPGARRFLRAPPGLPAHGVSPLSD